MPRFFPPAAQIDCRIKCPSERPNEQHERQNFRPHQGLLLPLLGHVVRLQLEWPRHICRHPARQQILAHDLRFPRIQNLLDLRVGNARFFLARIVKQLRLWNRNRGLNLICTRLSRTCRPRLDLRSQLLQTISEVRRKIEYDLHIAGLQLVLGEGQLGLNRRLLLFALHVKFRFDLGGSSPLFLANQQTPNAANPRLSRRPPGPSRSDPPRTVAAGHRWPSNSRAR